MSRLSFPVLDISAFIWSVDDFNSNKPAYYRLMEVMPNLLENIVTFKVPVVMRSKLLGEIQNYFPYDQIPNEYYAFQLHTLSFLSNVIPYLHEYPETTASKIKAEPDISRQYFSPSTQNEIQYLISYLHTDNSCEKKYLTFRLIWTNGAKLTTINGQDSREYDTVLCDDDFLHADIVNGFRRMFEHNPKHDKYNVGGKNSGLSCYNERIGDKTRAQELLDKAERFGNSYFSFDSENDVYVEFVWTGGNVYHGYDAKPNESELMELQKTFHK